MKRETVEAHGLKFIVAIEPDEEDGGYVAHCPTLRGCWSQGETVDEALTNITDAIVGCLAVPRSVLQKAEEEALTLPPNKKCAR
ncbi:MAG: type II toxin-antitoxin system HicB family antitoxin [Anaerolineae bacterium]|nr:type II toxin-antitoxin system HicB family antitoxin [Anaerolineae bacterium]